MGKKKCHIRLEVKQTEVQKSQKTANAQILCNSGGSPTHILSVKQTASSPNVPTKASQSGSNTLIVEPCVGDLDYESPLEKMIVKVTDKETLLIYIESWETYLKERQDIFSANTNVCYEEFEDLIRNKKLDANLTKCTKFVRKLRQYTDSQKASVESDIKALNLTKYLSEIAAALVESKIKLGDLSEIIDVCSMLHQRYADFSAALLENFKLMLLIRKVDVASSSIIKLTVDLRILADLILCGIISVNDGFPVLLESLKNVFVRLKDGTQSVAPALHMCRAVGYELTGILPKNIRKLSGKHGVKFPKCQTIPDDKKQQLASLLKDLYALQTGQLLNVHEESLRSEMYNRRLMKAKGELLPERIEKHAEITSKLDRVLLGVKKLAFILDFEVPDLRALPAADPEEEKELVVTSDIAGIVFFDDEETRAFYQDFPDLTIYLTPAVCREAAKEVEAMAVREKEASNIDEEAEKAELNSEEILEDIGDAEENELPPSMRQDEKELDLELKPSFQTYLDDLKNCVNRNMIDKAAYLFTAKFNNKQNRKKLARTVFHVPRQRVDLLSLWSRLIAILHPVMPDLGQELSLMLKKDFQYMLRKKHQTFVETKLKVTRMIAELVNFRVFPKSDALHCLKLLLMDFVHHQIEMCCAFIEGCGQFLHRHPESTRRFQIYLDEMMRKTKVKALEPRYLNLVEHAYNCVVRPKGTLAPKKKLPTLEAFIQKVVWHDLKKDNVEKTIEMLRSLEWETDLETCATVVRVLSNPCETPYNKLSHLASVIAGISEYRSEVGVKVLDKVLEDIKTGMDFNHVQFNQRRITMCVFLAQLYLYRIASGVHIFTALYDFITYGVKMGKLQRGQVNKKIVDRPDDLFRVRLACQILKICGEYFNHGGTKRTLDIYIKYLQRYFWSKRVHPFWKARIRCFPYGVLEDLEETIKRIRPNAKIYKSWDEAELDVRAMEKEIADAVKAELKAIGYDAVVAMENVTPELRQIIEEAAEAQKSRQEAEANWIFSSENAPQGTKSAWQVDDPYAKFDNRNNVPITDKEDAAFLKELERLCSEINYNASRDGGKYMTSTIPIPLNIRNDSIIKTGMDYSNGIAEQETVDFTLITRKGNKQQYKTLPVPASSDFAVNLRTREEAERAEKERVKIITLGLNDL